MDVSELLKDPRARAKDAEALAILTDRSHPAMETLDKAKREFGTLLHVSQMGALIDPIDAQMYKSGKRDATRLLFDTYATIIFSKLLDAEEFIAALNTIREEVEASLGVIDSHEAELCRLEWVKRAWDRSAAILEAALPAVDSHEHDLSRLESVMVRDLSPLDSHDIFRRVGHISL